jgi:hypothetical protein
MDNQIKKGDIVLVTASVYTAKSVPAQHKFPHKGVDKIIREPKLPTFPGKYRERTLRKIVYENPFEALVVGKDTRTIGNVFPGTWSHPGIFRDQEHVPVIMVQLLSTDSWLQPFACLESDLILKQK